MKIALVGPIYPWRGGIAHYTALLAQTLAQRHEVRVYTFDKLYPHWLFPGRSQRDPGPAPAALPDVRPWLVPWRPDTWLRLRRDWTQWQPSVVVIQWWVPFMMPMTAWLLANARRGCLPSLVVCHNVLPHERAAFDRALVRRALRNADGLVVHSQPDVDAAAALLPGMAVQLAPLPRHYIARRDAWTRERARAQLQIDGRLILFFGFVRPYKGLSDLLAAMQTVVPACGARLLVVGEIWGSAQPYLAQVHELGLEAHVTFVNRYVANDEAAAYMAAADVAVQPYRHATGSGVTQLAHSFGVPVIATHTGNLGDAIEDGVTGFLVTPGDVSGLAGAIIRFFQEGWASRFRAAIDQQHDRFSWENIAHLVEAWPAAGVPRRR